MEPYGADFAAVFAARWDLWGRQVWPRIESYLPPNAQGRAWLDLCCGTGALLQLAGARGYDVVGVDRSSHQLEHAARKAPRATLVEADITALSLGRRFDVVTCMFDSLNYLLRLADIDRALRVARRHLKANGVFIFDVKTVAGFAAERARVFKWPGQVVVFESEFDEGKAIHSFIVTGFVADGQKYRRFEERHVQRAFDADIIEGRLAKLGLEALSIDFDTAKAAGAQTRRLLYICTPAGAERRQRRRGLNTDG
jgi:SAM-dependent methyltransferase